MNGNHELMSFSNLTLKGDDEKITNKLAVTSLLYRFKVLYILLNNTIGNFHKFCFVLQRISQDSPCQSID